MDAQLCFQFHPNGHSQYCSKKYFVTQKVKFSPQTPIIKEFSVGRTPQSAMMADCESFYYEFLSHEPWRFYMCKIFLQPRRSIHQTSTYVYFMKHLGRAPFCIETEDPIDVSAVKIVLVLQFFITHSRGRGSHSSVLRNVCLKCSAVKQF